ncbi:hypothetical protein DXT99_22555 [Pontibacter diazotrophicus]|uniref:DUF5362 domain-containing protein n=1 Tax=Pontibacter diazotrophicus TaxID=1400979 RepID=A0A3D8L597_9BACT|nr:DUF5362 family protein [Pontibacter diazotrophicus]RDV12550.1 hypothetical protein DXT99_22555 [Pontibacter diazotrophicus]
MDTFYENNMPLGLRITPPSAEFLRTAARWGKFLAIIGFVMIGFMVLMALGIGAFMSGMMQGMNNTTGVMSALGSSFFSIFYLLFALLYFFPVLYLYRFSSKVQRALDLQSETEIDEAFKNLKSLLKFMGVLTIIVLAFYVLSILVVFLGIGIGSMM